MIQPIRPKPILHMLPFMGRLEARPTYDTFTGLKDKRCLLKDLDARMQAKEDIAIGMCDIDNFKSINELLGYKTGDEFIRALSTDISTIADKHDIEAYRFGGDEFVVLLFTGKDKDKNMQIMQEIIDLAYQDPILEKNKNKYRRNAEFAVQRYEASNEKIRTLNSLKERRAFIDEVFDNAGQPVRDDSYMQKIDADTKEQLGKQYNSMIQESLETEQNKKARKLLKEKSNAMLIDEYLYARYDKNAEAYKVKKWLSDYNKNGFSLTGGIAYYNASAYQGMQPIDLIDSVGEHLKHGKDVAKGKVFSIEIQ